MKKIDQTDRAIPPIPGGGSWRFDDVAWAWQAAHAVLAAAPEPEAPVAPAVPAAAEKPTTTEE